jgi:ubiquinone/menaquinone biosynthesis C-methylase UbiE
MSDNYYNDNVEEVAQQYLSLSFDEVHGHWAHHLEAILKKPNASILDVGAGAGRDVSHIASLAAKRSAQSNIKNNSLNIYAIEPAVELLKVGQKTTENQNIHWIQDLLPTLYKTTRLEISFDLILLSAVWMHIPKSQRARSIRKLANILKPGGKIIISLKFGMSEEDQKLRGMHHISADEIEKLGQDLGLVSTLETQNEKDKLNRDGIYWQTVVLQMPDDGTGAFPFIRHVAINDGKAATHKLALLRVLLRIADGHAGAVLRRESSIKGDRVILPLGLVALYWIHQYKDLIDDLRLFQTPNSKPNMGFMKPNGWHRLKHRKASDYRVGNLFVGDDAIALHRTLSASATNIKEMPCDRITFTNTKVQVFEVDQKRVNAKKSIFLDLQTLSQWGEFSLPESTWLALSRYACWIEPVLVSEWVKTMASYKGNKAFALPDGQTFLYNALKWEEPKRSTFAVRERFSYLATTQQMQCVWSAKKLKYKYDIDHSMPFSRWPNNDLWNLVPSDSKVNNDKRDRLPSEKKLVEAKERMLQWWEAAWLDGDGDSNQKQRFFAEANIALPSLTPNNDSIDDLFEALLLQRGRLKDMQQLNEW